jgi:hypothetical protein
MLASPELVNGALNGRINRLAAKTKLFTTAARAG